jgi:hypothetical protein
MLPINPIGLTALGRLTSIYPPDEFGFEVRIVSYILIHIFPSCLNANKQSPLVDSPILDIDLFLWNIFETSLKIVSPHLLIQQSRPSPEFARGRAAKAEFVRGRATATEFARGRATKAEFARGRAAATEFARGRAAATEFARGCATATKFTRGCATKAEFARGRAAATEFARGRAAKAEFARGRAAATEFAICRNTPPDPIVAGGNVRCCR